MKIFVYALSALIVLGAELDADFNVDFNEPEVPDQYTDPEHFEDFYGPGSVHDHEEFHEEDMHAHHYEEGELTSENFDEETEGKMVFVKFFSPWCENCTEMEPAWMELRDTYEGVDSVVIAEVDCHGPGEDLCINRNIDDHFPTLMYGDPKNMKQYTGSFEYYDLLAFALKNIKAICGPSNMNLCDADQKTKINSLLGQGLESLREKINGVEEVIHSTETNFEVEVEKLYDDIEQKYNKLLAEKEKSLDELREKNDIGLMRTVLDHLREKFPDHIDL